MIPLLFRLEDSLNGREPYWTVLATIGAVVGTIGAVIGYNSNTRHERVLKAFDTNLQSLSENKLLQKNLKHDNEIIECGKDYFPPTISKKDVQSGDSDGESEDMPNYWAYVTSSKLEAIKFYCLNSDSYYRQISKETTDKSIKGAFMKRLTACNKFNKRATNMHLILATSEKYKEDINRLQMLNNADSILGRFHILVPPPYEELK